MDSHCFCLSLSVTATESEDLMRSLHTAFVICNDLMNLRQFWEIQAGIFFHSYWKYSITSAEKHARPTLVLMHCTFIPCTESGMLWTRDIWVWRQNWILLVDQHSCPHLWPWHVGRDWKNKKIVRIRIRRRKAFSALTLLETGEKSRAATHPQWKEPVWGGLGIWLGRFLSETFQASPTARRPKGRPGHGWEIMSLR